MKTENSIAYNLVIAIKEILKFTLIAVISMWILGVLTLYLFMDVLKFDTSMSVLITVVVVVVTIITINEKILHTTEKIDECMMKIVDKLFRN